MDESRKDKLGRIIMHGVSIALLMLTLVFSVFKFDAVFFRALQAFKDLGLSFAYYLTELVGFDDLITPTVNDIPSNAIEVLPFNPKEFTARLTVFGRLLVSQKNLKDFVFVVLELLLVTLPIIISFLPVLAMLLYFLRKHSKKQVGEEFQNRKTWTLKVFQAVELVTWVPIKKALSRYVTFIQEEQQKRYLTIFAVLWVYNLNAITIIVELFAYLFYFSVSFDVINIFTQIAKLAMDLTVAIDFLPWWAWVIGGYIVFDLFRKFVGMKRLEEYEEHNREWLREHPGSLFVVGKQRSGKGMLITDMGLSMEQEFRDNARKDLLKRDKQFPYFPWVNVDLFHKKVQTERILPNLVSYEKFVRRLELRFKYRARYEGTELGEWVQWWNKKLYGYEYEDFIFGYDYKRYGLEYNNGLKMVSAFEAISGYFQLLYIYAAKKSLIFGNYPIRTDLIWKDNKIFPAFDGDFFKRKPQELKSVSGYCNIANMDYWRLGKLVDEDNPDKDLFEVGVANLQEWAKDRGNQITNQGIHRDSALANAKNDRLELNMKIQTHGSTVENYTYFKMLTDDQRADSLGAENKDLCDVAMIKNRGEGKSVLPFPWIEKLIGRVAGLFYDKHHEEQKENRADHSLIGYLMKKLFTPLMHYVERRNNVYSVARVDLRVIDGMLKDVKSDKDVYYLCSKKIYADRYVTNNIRPFYRKKNARSKRGIEDAPAFSGREMSPEEMKKVNSYCYMLLNNVFSGDAKIVDYEEMAAQG